MISLKISKKPDDEWNTRIIGSGLSTIYQTIERADFFKEAKIPYYFLKFVSDDNEIVGQLLVNISERFTNNSFKSKLLKNSPFLKKKICIWSYGPIIINEKFNLEIFQKLKEFLDDNNYLANGWLHPLSPMNNSFLKTHFKTRKWGTFLIDLKKSKDELYNNLQRNNAKKNIKRAQKRGVIIEKINDNNLIDYFNIRNNYKQITGQGEANYERFFYKWKKYSNLGYSGFLARKDGVPVGGLIFSYLDGHIIESGVARTELDSKENLYSQDLIKWKIIEWGCENKMNFYNLTGFNPEPISKKEEGIFRYKQKWGGDICEYYRILGTKKSEK